ncbi:MAG: hypothetical protein CMH41_09975 [Micrococcales bacterium]|nr:hypothetical protein [Micrococcales bacterium]
MSQSDDTGVAASAPFGATEPRHTHPLTPLANGARFLPVALLAGIVLVGQNVDASNLVLGLLLTAAGVVVISLLIAGLSWIAWRRLTFWFDDQGDFRVASGVLTRTERRLQLSRLQGVDVVEPFIPRIFGLAQVTIEVAGAGDSRAQIQYLSRADAQDLRNSVVARAAGLHPDVGEAPQQALVAVPSRDLVISLLLRGSTVALVLLTVVIVVATLMTAGPVGLLWILLGGIPLIAVIAEYFGFYNFTIAKSADGLRTRAGLFQVQAQTIPPGRLQAVEFVQSWLWRRKDWVRVRITVAGMASDDDQNQSGSSFRQVLLPVAPYDVALSVVNEILPGVNARNTPLHRAPARARWRAPIQHKFLGVGWDDRVFVTDRGRFVRRLAVAPHARTQSVRVTQGPWQRWLDLATMHLDSPVGPAKVIALYRAAEEARQLADEQNARAQIALKTDPAGRWMQAGNRQDDS